MAAPTLMNTTHYSEGLVYLLHRLAGLDSSDVDTLRILSEVLGLGGGSKGSVSIVDRILSNLDN